MSVDAPGLTRRRSGRGFSYLDADGRRVTDPDVLARCQALVIPPAWQEVWICRDPAGHVQAVGTDDAGRRQYLYHEKWRERRERAKHHHVLEVAKDLPAARRTVAEHLALPGFPRDRALAVAFRLLDGGAFRIGGEVYATRHETYGLATLRKDHLRISRDGALEFRFVAKSGMRQSLVLHDDELVGPLTTLRRRRGGGDELLAYRDGARRWVDVSSADISTYLKERLGPEASAKDFRTWRGTVLAAVTLAQADPPTSAREEQAAVRAAVARVAQELGNTPAVARGSYIDPQVVAAFARGQTVPAPATTPEETEVAVIELLS
ncbi:DNA topoisomerase IB [Georgenia sp. MJ170]|uniref:DNA topoisomerase IB n=1 Tax=Georgenia sunbinii TaxID=3117728 RepID=UPI002F261800